MKLPPAFKLVIAALKNVPFDGEGAANANGARIDGAEGQLAVVTETWDERTKDAIREHNPELEWLTAPGQSVMVGHNPARFRLQSQGVIPGGCSPEIKGLCDRRDLFWKILVDLLTGERVALLGIHTAPVRPKLGRAMVARAKAGHQVLRLRIRRFMSRHKALVLAAGDFNEAHLVRVLTVAGGKIGNGIVHAELEDGLLNLGAVGFTLHSDHRGVKVRLRSRGASARP